MSDEPGDSSDSRDRGDRDDCGDFLEGYLPYVLRRADQTLSAPFYSALTRYGVARSEWRVLAVLHEFGQLTVLDVASAALSPQPTVTHALRRLEERGLVSRTADVGDRRRRLISMTPAGVELTRALIAEARRLEAAVLDDIDGLPELVAGLNELTALVEARMIADGKAQAEAGTA